ncbi:SPL family radical SAM protein [Candidatus Hecatella orcuttiae]|uniref:SPL family radical SAM protein n=1 Tax=Candidatus Hecatella orcuttiae TaxID=1935119 RepID=UPI002868348F|nr:hypothetical protein [Candidatus Hecatella orcuttiae]
MPTQTTLHGPAEKPVFRRRKRQSPFIRLFNKAPAGILCPNFWLLAWADGCPYQCTYCFLQGTFRGQVEPVVFINLNDLFRELDSWLKADGAPRLLNAGELTDSLAITTYVAEKLVERFGKQSRHKLLLLTKSDGVNALLSLPHRGQTILSFSLNPPTVAKRFELGAPPPWHRLDAATAAKKAGYPVRIRVDPMIPVEGWREAYTELADRISRLRPERVTLGSLRFFPIVPAHSRRDKSVFSYGGERSGDGRIRVPRDTRMEMYRLMVERLEDVPVGLCKETVDVVKALGLPNKCNCVL